MKLVRLRSRANATFVLDRGGRATRDIRGTFIGTLSLRFAGVGHLRTLCFGGGEGVKISEKIEMSRDINFE